MLLILGLCLLLCLSSSQASFPGQNSQVRSNFRIWQQWTYLDFKFPSNAARINDINLGYFVLNASVPLDMSVDYRNGSPSPRVFVSNPRFEGNRPVTLGVVGTNGIIEPYPNYDWHKNQGRNCNGLTSVFRTEIDTCNRLWVLDAGRIGDSFPCKPQVVAFDLATDREVYQYRISDKSIKSNTLLVTPAVDKGRTCDDMFLYLADAEAFALIVVDVKNRKDWRVQHSRFYPYPNKITFNILGQRFDSPDGVLGLALNPRRNGPNGDVLYFHSLAATTENIIRTADLQNSSLVSPDAPLDKITEFYYQRDSQSGAEAIDKNGIMYFGLMDLPRVACWNTATQFRQENIHIIANDPNNLQFLSGVKVVTNSRGRQEVWVMASAFNKVATGTLSSTAPNFKISMAYVDDILRSNPQCADTVGFRDHPYSGR